MATPSNFFRGAVLDFSPDVVRSGRGAVLRAACRLHGARVVDAERLVASASSSGVRPTHLVVGAEAASVSSESRTRAEYVLALLRRSSAASASSTTSPPPPLLVSLRWVSRVLDAARPWQSVALGSDLVSL